MIRLREDQCSGCGICQSVCMFGGIGIRDEKAYVTDACTGCGACVRQCPCDALELPQREEKAEDLEAYKDVWVVLETDQSGKQLKKVSLELLSEARRLADLLGQKVEAVLLADELPKGFEDNLSYVGCDAVHVVLHEELKRYDTLVFSDAIVKMAKKYKPAVILLPATENGRDLAPRVSCSLQTGLTADCTALDIDEKGNLVQIRPTYGGNIMASIVTPCRRPQMASVRPNVLSIEEAKKKKKPSFILETIETDCEKSGYRFIEAVEREDVFEDVAEASIVIVAGYGIGSKENFDKIKKLAGKMNAAVGATRKVVDEGWAPFEVQVGQTGKTIAPDVYISFGVSGALQHTIGMQKAKFKLAVNNDPAAAIFKMCDAAILGDAGEVADALLSEITG